MNRVIGFIIIGSFIAIVIIIVLQKQQEYQNNPTIMSDELRQAIIKEEGLE